ALLEEVLPLPMPIRLMGLTLSKLEGNSDQQPRPDAQLSLL
ncbi:MAG TPA: DNA polymerase IV, partial [Erythrobacter sp.]|nr:DNA polymerase IV [Erythrobacter sp.]